MKIAVLTLTRDRLDYTKHCFASLQENAGCEYDHYVLDQGSQDGTAEWLREHTDTKVFALDRNFGVCPGLNILLDRIPVADYDVIVRFDNDCEVVQPDTLAAVATIAYEHDVICAPKVNGLFNPPPTRGEWQVGDHVIDGTDILGGIFMAIPAWLFSHTGYRYDETSHLHMGDEAIVPWFRQQGGVAGYVRGVEVNHYETTAGQRERHPEYWVRKDAEFQVAA